MDETTRIMIGKIQQQITVGQYDLAENNLVFLRDRKSDRDKIYFLWACLYSERKNYSKAINYIKLAYEINGKSQYKDEYYHLVGLYDNQLNNHNLFKTALS